jgi:omega-amidase
MQNISLSLLQTPLFWENPEKNLEMFSSKIAAIKDPADLIVLPEMFTTGFSMNPGKAAEPMDGPAMQWMRRTAAERDCVLAGSLAIAEGGQFFNRFIWMQPDGQFRQYDKYHLFSFAGENKHYTPGSDKLIVNLKGWKIMPLICYDLRFPVWSRNRHDPETGFDYDVLLYVANWPESRSHAWRVLLMARAIENLSYVVGLNRIGEDGNGVSHSGDSAVIDPTGENLGNFMPKLEQVETIVLPRCPLENLRNKFRAWADWDGGFILPARPVPPAGSQ